MRAAADGPAALLGQNLDGAQPEAALEREVAEEPARALVQVGRERPADVLATWADARFLVPPRPGAERPRMTAPKALDGEWLHRPVFGHRAVARVPRSRDAL
jgi:hypothetical protein